MLPPLLEKRHIQLNHTGNLGDLFYAFPFIFEMREFLHAELTLHLQTGIDFKYKFEHPNGMAGFTQGNVDFLMPLLKTVPIFKEITSGDEIPPLPEEKIDLSLFRKLPINFQAGNIVEWYYNLMHIHLPHDYTTPRLTVEPDYALRDKILLVNSKRYNNVFLDLKALEEFKDKLVFVGLEDEHKEFEEKNFEVDFFKVSDALHFARVLKGAIGIVANQTGLFAIAEQMKVPRILLSAEFIDYKGRRFPGPHNVIPCGGWFEVAEMQTKLIASMRCMISM